MARTDRSERDGLEWLFVLLVITLAVVHLYVGIAVESAGDFRSQPFLVVGGVFLVGLALYVSPFWRSPLYLVFVLFAASLGWIWLLGGMPHFVVGVVTGVIATASALVSAYLFYREERRIARM